MNTRTVIVTGAGGALGAAVGAAFARSGARRVLMLDIQESVLQRACALFPEQMRAHALDLRDISTVQDSFAHLIADEGAPDLVCNIAGGFDCGPAVHETTPELWQRMVDLNVVTLLNVTRMVVPPMLAAKRGCIVNVAAQGAVTGKPGMGAYCATKSAVARLTESMAFELRESGINVNAVAPTIIDTPANRKAMPDADPTRWVAIADLVAVIEFLASPAARALHGAVIPVSGLS